MMDELQDALDLANKAGNAIKTAFETVKALRTSAQSSEFAGEIAEVSLQVSDVRVQMAQLESMLGAVKRSVAATDAIHQRKRNYVLAETPTGSFVYRLKDDAYTGEPAHYACPVCFETDQIVPLQPIYSGRMLECPSCQWSYRLEPAN